MNMHDDLFLHNPFTPSEIAGHPQDFYGRVQELKLMSKDEATELIQSKLALVVAEAEENEIILRVEPSIIKRIVALSGGHPHILQLLGSHLIEHENDEFVLASRT